MAAWKRMFFAPDDGGGGGAPPAPEGGQGEPAAPAAGSGAADPPQSKGWKYASQLSPEARTKYAKDIEGLADKRLDDVVGELFDSRARLSRAIIPPTKDSKPEEVESFLKAMGIPKTAAEYELAAESMKGIEGGDQFVDRFRELAHASALSKKQAGKVFEFIANLTKGAADQAKAARAEAEASFDTRLAQSLNPDGKLSAQQVDEQVAATKNRLTTFLAKRGASKDLVRDMADKGILFDPRYVGFFSGIEKAFADPAFIDGRGSGGGAPKRGKMGDYSPDFADRFGGKE